MGSEVKDFIERWQAAEGNEQREANSFWIELCQLLGVERPTQYLQFERKVKGRRIDVFYPDMGILIENKSRGVDLDKRYERGKNEGGDARTVTPYEQAKWYADNLPRSSSPRWIIVCNFDEIRIHDLNQEKSEKDFVTLHLANLEREIHTLSFFTDKTKSKLYIEKELSIDAGVIVGKLYDKLSEQYAHIETDPHEQHSLNVLIVRLIFLLYAEDAGMLQGHQAFYEYMKTIPAHLIRATLIDLFRVLDTPEDQRDPYDNPELNKFPYINGGLFADNSITIPQFTEELRVELLEHASCGFNWKGISPTIFGAVFESTLNPETRRKGGMHYTSIENIHKVIDPLFLDDLKNELIKIEGRSQENVRKRELQQFWDKLAKLTFLDPACGSGNFLTETYISLCNLEIQVAQDIIGNSQTMLLTPAVSILQFYGIEINNFAVSVAKTALWIAEHQMFEKFVEIMPFCDANPLPLKNNNNIHCTNALRIDWNEVVPASECNYIIGNPPFVGYSLQSKEQKKDILDIYVDENGKAYKRSGKIDYVAGWYFKASQMMVGTNIRTALVSTNSITQGEQVAGVWQPLYERFKIHIDFAHRTFRWDSEANLKAQVHCVIVGFSCVDTEKKNFLFSGERCQECNNINPYLASAPLVFISNRQQPLCAVPRMTTGNRPTDGGALIIEAKDYAEFLRKEPKAKKYIKKLLGSEEFINNKQRYCLWLVDITPVELRSMPEVLKRVELCRQARLNSPDPGRRKLADKPTQFRETLNPDNYIIIPSTSSERRRYVPIGFLKGDTISTNANLIIPEATIYHFGVLTSNVHMAWMRLVCGRLKSDYRYSKDLIYNNFPWPTPTDTQKEKISRTAQAILDARAKYPECSLADLYEEGKMPPELRKAHRQNDLAVMEAYDFKATTDETDLVAALMQMYKKLADAKETK